VNPAERFEAAGAYLVRAGGGAAPGELADALGGLNAARLAELTRALREAGYATGPRTRLQLTDAGWSHFAGVEGAPAGEVLDRVLDGWPQAHRAFVELLVSAIVARHHLADRYGFGHLAFMAIGPTATGKSATAGLVCRLFGLDVATHTLYLPEVTPGEVMGRRVQDADGWHLEPAPVTQQPFLLLDEFDKADDATRRQALAYLHDQPRRMVGSELRDLKPTTLLAANPPTSGERYRMLRQEYRRRSVVLDTAGTKGIADVLRHTYDAWRPADRLDLAQLEPPADELPDPARAVLQSLVDNVLTEDGSTDDFPGVPALELAALGRWALLGPDADPAAAALGVAVAYAQVTGTVPGMVKDGWQLDLAAVRSALGADGEAIAAAVERGRAERATAVDEVRQVRRRHVQADYRVLEDAATLAAQLRELHDALDGRKMPEDLHAVAKGRRAVLRLLADRAGKVSTAASLDDVRADAAEPMDRARELVAKATTARLERQQYARAEAERQRREGADRRAAAAQQRAATTAGRKFLRDQLAEVVTAARPLEQAYRRKTTRPGENVLDELKSLTVDRRPILRYRVSLPAPEQPRKGLGRLLGGTREPMGVWTSAIDPGVYYAGTQYGCRDLAAWGRATRDMLTPPLRLLHRSEDDLRARLGMAPRSARPQLVEPVRKPVAQLPALPARPPAQRPTAPAPAASPFRIPREVLEGPARYGLPALEAGQS